MKSVIVLPWLLILIVLDASATDYCASSLCPSGKRHILCNKDNGDGETNNYFYNRCFAKCRLGNIPKLKEVALRQINNIRNQIAAGYHPLLPQASRMGVIGWDDELANMGETIAKVCAHEKGGNLCLNTPAFRNVSWLFNVIGASNNDYSSFVKQAITQWRVTEKFLTRKDVSNPTDKFLRNSEFTILINQRVTRVGCGINIMYGSAAFLACLFSTSNVAGVPVYEAGRAASKCKTGRSACYTALCSEKEQF